MPIQFFLLSFLFVPILTIPVQVEIVSILPYDLKIAAALIWNGAALDLAVQAANEKYSPFLKMKLHFLHNVSHRNCDDISSDAISELSKYYYSRTSMDSLYVIMTSCKSDDWSSFLFTDISQV
jgi:hypothetical protein